MPTDHILALLVAERDKLNRAIDALQGAGHKRRGRPPQAPAASASDTGATGKAHHMRSAAARKAQAARMREYWKKKKAASKK